MQTHRTSYTWVDVSTHGVNQNMGLTPAKAVGIAIGVYVLAAVIPGAIDSFETADTTNFSANTLALWGLIPLGIVVGLVLAFMPRGGSN